MGALRIFVWFLALVTALDSWVQTREIRLAMTGMLSLRHTVLSKDPELSQKFCESAHPHLELFYREENLWTDVCSSFSGFSELPRYWKLTVRYKYKLLFTRELPITVSIVISA